MDKIEHCEPLNGMAYRYVGKNHKHELGHLIHYFVGKDPTGYSWVFVAKTEGMAKLHWRGYPHEYERYPEKDMPFISVPKKESE